MNILQQWEKAFRKEILADLASEGISLKQENIEAIIAATSYASRKVSHPDKCPYYSQETSCHPEIEGLNCFLCACPHYQSENLEGGCSISSPAGKFHTHPNLPAGRVWDCSYCTINHSPDEVRQYLTEHLASRNKV